MKTILVCVFLFASVFADLYMQNPRGSNDRLNEANTNRNNANRLFDSQNNAKGGYCYGPSMTFYEKSLLSIEWTNQHGCGSNPKLTCNLVIQYMCQDNSAGTSDYVFVRDGQTTDTIPDDPTGPTATTNGDYTYGMHEPYQYYQDCKTRDRNMGLFIADRESEGGLTAGRASAIFTRQNNNGNRFAYECTEERDYYPYWHPSPWKDVAILTESLNYCQFYQAESQNVKAKNYCQPSTGAVTDPTQPSMAEQNNEAACKVAGNTWTETEAWGIDPPECLQAPWSRENHLGNGMDNGASNRYNWTLPATSQESCISTGTCNCVLRMRYNISTVEYGYDSMSRPDYGFVDSSNNAANSPVLNDEIVYQDSAAHQLALDTTQFGRTFEDRSHVFHIAKRPSGVPSSARVFNLNVRGKRGNIVQTYPATEYDFVPQYMYTRVGDYVHFQWTGCDTNPAGNAGEGTDQTDRSNIVQIPQESASIPADDTWISANPSKVLFKDTATRLRFAMLDQVGCLTWDELLQKNNQNENAAEQDLNNCMKLNAASEYFDGGVHKMNHTGTYYYMSTRNHNFSNRDQKGTLYVKPLLDNWAIGVVIAGASLFGVAAIIAGMMFYAKSHPHSGVANMFSKM